MRWRPGPRLAFALGLLGACVAALQLLRPNDAPSLLPDITFALSGPASALATPAGLPSTPVIDKSLSSGKPTPSMIDTTLSRDPSGCAGARSTAWNPLAGVEYTGRVRIDLPARSGGAIVLFIGDTIPLDVEAATTGRDVVRMQQRRLRPGPGLQIPPDFWLEDDNPWRAPGHIIHATIDAFPDRDLTFVVSLGRRAPRVLVRLIGYAADVRVPVCAVPVRAGETYFATGWYAEQPSGPNTERWMRDVGSVLVQSDRGQATTVRIRATAAASTDEDRAQLTLRVNDVLEMPAVPMLEGVADYEWHVPDAAWVPGTNELLFRVSRTAVRGTRVFGMGLRELTLLNRD